MKKLISFLFMFVLFSFSFATNPCNYFIEQKVNKLGTAKFAANMRTYPCISKSKVVGVSKKGKQYHIIGQVSGWYHIILDNGQKTWIWDKSIYQIRPFYTLTYKDRQLVNKVNQKIYQLIKKKGISYKYKVVKALEKLLVRFTHKPRIYAILQEILNYTKNINFEEKSKNQIQENKKIVTNQTQQVSENKKTQQTNSESITGNAIKINGTYYDLEKVKKAWLLWHNQERKKIGLKPYSYSLVLEKSAKARSDEMARKNKMEHKRHPNDSYYDYWKIASWMKNHGVVCENIHRATFSESIGYQTIKCTKSDCTDALLDGAKNIFNFYMNEKGKKWDPHYRGIVHPLFTMLGFGINIKYLGNGYWKYYFTTHYCTKLK